MLPNPNYDAVLMFSRDGISWMTAQQAFEAGFMVFEEGLISDGTYVFNKRPPRTLWQHLIAWWEGR
jgi:hypothetical protein